MLEIFNSFILWATSLPDYVLWILPLVGLYGMWRTKQKLAELKFAEYLVEKGQFEKADEAEIQGLLNFASGLGKHQLVINKLADLRLKYGPDGVKKGHIYIFVQLLSDPESISFGWDGDFPEFSKEED